MELIRRKLLNELKSCKLLFKYITFLRLIISSLWFIPRQIDLIIKNLKRMYYFLEICLMKDKRN